MAPSTYVAHATHITNEDSIVEMTSKAHVVRRNLVYQSMTWSSFQKMNFYKGDLVLSNDSTYFKNPEKLQMN